MAQPDTAEATAGQPATIDVLGNDTSTAAIVPSSVVVTTQPTNGTAVAQSDGTIVYTPDAGFVGADQFIYDVGDTNTQTSNAADVVVNVGTSLSSAKGGAKTLRFTDAGGGTQTISLNVGTVGVFFNGSGKVTTAKGVSTVTGTGLDISDLRLANTTRASTLSIRGSAAAPVTVGGVNDATALNAISAPSADFGGTMSLAGVNTIAAGGVSGATITIGAAATKVSLNLGSVSDTSLTSSVPITTLKVLGWTDTAAHTVAAPAIGTLNSAGTFDPSVALSGTLGSARIGENLTGVWQVGGTAGVIRIGSNFTGGLSTGMVKAVNVVGGMTGATLMTTGAAGVSLGSLTVGGVISGSTITSAGSMNLVSAGSLTDSTLTAGTAAGTTLANVTADDIGSAFIRTVRLTGQGFDGSTIVAGTITTASISGINTIDTGGIAAKSFHGVTGLLAGTAFHLTAADLASNTALTAAIAARGLKFGEFEIAVV